MITKLKSHEELVQIITETFFNKTDKITKVSKHSGLSGLFNATAKVSQKSLQEIARNEAHLFPDVAFGSQLDKIAEDRGIAPRFGASKSSTYVRVVGSSGTTYTAGTQVFESPNESITFDLEETITIPDSGFAYAKVKSQTTGVGTNVDELSITEVTPEPTGHTYVVNEYKATGGRDQESDQLFRRRIKEGPNILATGTLKMLEQAFMKVNNDVLRVLNNGIDANGNVVLTVISQNGIDFSQSDLDNMLEEGEKFFALTELKPNGKNSYGTTLQNVNWFPIDISFRVQILQNYSSDDVRRNIQIRFSKYLDVRKWESGDTVQWDDLLGLAKRTEGVKYIPDQFFTPNNDIRVPINQIPRIRGFRMLDLDGNIIEDVQGNLNPQFYPNKADFNYQETVLKNI